MSDTGANDRLNLSSKRMRFLVSFPRQAEVKTLPAETVVSFVPMDGVSEFGSMDTSIHKFLGDVYNGYTFFREYDVVVAKITPCFENGKGAIAKNLANGIGFGTTEFTVLRSGPSMEPRFLYYFTVSHYFRGLGEGEMYGAGGQKRVPDSFFKNVRLPDIQRERQVEIADFLDRETAKADALVAEYERLIELLEEKRSALTTQAVTKGLDPTVPMKDSGVEWIGEIPRHWSIVPFRYCAAIAEGQVDPKDRRFSDMVMIAPNHIESNTGRLLAQETADKQAAISGKYLVSRGDIVYSKIRPGLNKVTIAPFDCLCSADMYPIRPSRRMDTPFLLFSMLARPFNSLATELSMRVAMPKINRQSLASIKMLVPQIQEQQRIVTTLQRNLKQADGLVSETHRAIRLTREHRAALITAAITDRIDVATYRSQTPATHESVA